MGFLLRDVGEIMKKSTIAFFLAAGSLAFGSMSSAKADSYDIGISGLTLTYTGGALSVTGAAGSGYIVNGAPSTTGSFSFTSPAFAVGAAENLNLVVTGGPSLAKPTVTDSNVISSISVSVGDTYVTMTGFVFNGITEPGAATLRISAFDAAGGNKTITGETADLMFSTPAPLPGTAWAAGALLTGMGFYRRFRRPMALS